MKDRMDEIRSTASPRLREDQIEVLMRYGETRKTVAGQVLSRAGDASNDFIVVLEGALEVVDDFAGEARIMVIQRGRFCGRAEHAHRAGEVPLGRGARGRGGAGHTSRATEEGRYRGTQPLGHHPEGLPG